MFIQPRNYLSASVTPKSFGRTILIGGLACSLTLVLCGCICGTCSKSAGRRTWAAKPVFIGSSETPLDRSKATVKDSAAKNHSARYARRAIADPIAAALIDKALQDALDKLQTAMNNAPADIKAEGSSLEGDGHALLTDFDARFKNHMERTVEQLNHTQRELWNSAEALTVHVERATQQIEASAFEAAKITLWEADIVAYDGVRDLPCQARDSRVLYASSLNQGHPLQMRLGFDPPEFSVRGNYLTYAPPTVSVDSLSAQVKTSNQNGYDVLLPDDVITSVETSGEKNVVISSAPASCHCKAFWRSQEIRGQAQSVSLLVKPSIKFDVSATIQPLAEVPAQLWWPVDFYRSDDDCNVNTKIDHRQCLPPDPDLKLVIEPQPWKIYTTTANCGSGIEVPQVQTDHCISVAGRLKGCGSFHVGPIEDCHGRGWIGYHMDMHYNGFERQSLPTQDWHLVNPPPGDYDTAYIQAVPAGSRHFIWSYVVRVVVHEGPKVHSVMLTSDVHDAEGIMTHFDETTLHLHIKLPIPPPAPAPR
jgi:hypothetical protein